MIDGSLRGRLRVKPSLLFSKAAYTQTHIDRITGTVVYSDNSRGLRVKIVKVEVEEERERKTGSW